MLLRSSNVEGLYLRVYIPKVGSRAPEGEHAVACEASEEQRAAAATLEEGDAVRIICTLPRSDVSSRVVEGWPACWLRRTESG